jgi:DNA polymerase III delta subunit
MFTTKKLIIIYGIPRDAISTNKSKASDIAPIEKLFQQSRDQIPTDSVVIFVSYKPDKRTKGYKFFSKHTTLKEFKPLKEIELINFIKQQLPDLIDGDSARHLLTHVGTNLHNLAHECEKLHSYASFHHIQQLDIQTIDLVTYQQSEANSFAILDNLYTDKTQTLQIIQELQRNQQDIFQFLGMMYWGIKLVIQIVQLHDTGTTKTKQIASEIKMHPFAVSKQLKHIDKLKAHYPQTVSLYHQLLDLDEQIKTGQLPPEGFWLTIKKLMHSL